MGGWLRLDQSGTNRVRWSIVLLLGGLAIVLALIPSAYESGSISMAVQIATATAAGLAIVTLGNLNARKRHRRALIRRRLERWVKR